ncbi:HU family DNA-binding protein [Streptomyces antimycoticus]
MNKTQLINAVAEKTGGHHAATVAVEAVLDALVRAVASGETISGTGFGTLAPKWLPAHAPASTSQPVSRCRRAPCASCASGPAPASTTSSPASPRCPHLATASRRPLAPRARTPSSHPPHRRPPEPAAPGSGST